MYKAEEMSSSERSFIKCYPSRNACVYASGSHDQGAMKSKTSGDLGESYM